MSSKLCPFCMRMTDSETCPHCGKNVNYAGSTAHLPAGYVVSGKHPYVLGAALGQGGFGITYIALDMVTGERVAIKEYYPTYCSVRSNAATVAPYTNQEEVYVKGKERFLDEARTLNSLSDLKSIVNVLDFFEANNTAYLVTEYLDGKSLKEHAAKNGKFPAQKFLDQIRPLMEDIHRMHERGVIHRDIAPDNIILLSDGQMKLIDFGAARSYLGDKSMTVVVKKGFAPVEQYLSKGSTAASDVYALAATIYYCITGKVPPDSAERQYDSAPLPSPSSLGVDITPQQDKALFHALQIQQKERTQSVQELLDNLRIRKPVRQKPEQPKPDQQTPVKQEPEKREAKKPSKKENRKPSGKKWIPITAAVAILVVILGGWFGLSGKDAAPAAEPASTAPVIPPDNWKNNILMADPLSALPQIAKANIQSVTFLDTCADAPEDAWDVSEAKNGTVLVWSKRNGSQFDVWFAGEGGINGEKACEGLFSYCISMNSVYFGDAFHTDYVTNMSNMFESCYRLTELDLGSWDTSNVTSMYKMFSSCRNLTSLNIGTWDIANVTTIESMFNGCSKLTALDTREWDTSNITNMSWAFANCTSLASLDVSKWDTTRLTNLNHMFNVCKNLQTLDVSGWNTSNVQNMQAVFYYCEKLDDLDVRAWDTTRVKDVSYMFNACTKLSNLDIRNWNISNLVSYEHFMSPGKQIKGMPWKDCFLSLKWLDNMLIADPLSALANIPRDKIQNVTFLDTCDDAPTYAWDVSEAKNGTVLAWSKKAGSYHDVFFAAEGGINAQNACSYLFHDCSSLKSVHFGNAFHSNHAADMSGMFYNCYNLTEVDADSLNTSSATDMSAMFSMNWEYPGKLKDLDVSGWDTSCVTDMSWMFYSCENLTSLDVSRWNTSVVEDMYYMFNSCNELTELDISNWDVSNVTDFHGFMSDDALLNGIPWYDYFIDLRPSK